MAMSVRRCAAATMVGLLLAAPATGADLPSRVMSQAPVFAPVARPRWQGAYFGGHLGGLWTDWNTDVGFRATNCSVCGAGEVRTARFPGPGSDLSAVSGGLQAGYNWQSESLVYGLEVDGSLTNATSNRSFGLSAATLTAAGL